MRRAAEDGRLAPDDDRRATGAAAAGWHGAGQRNAAPRERRQAPIATPRHTKQELQALRADLEANEAEGLADELVSAGLSEQDAAKAGVKDTMML